VKVNAFSKPVSDCVNYFELDRGHNFVDLDRVIDECVAIIFDQLPRETKDSAYRVPPLALTRLARGGKTITLAGVFEKLKKESLVKPILVTFNHNGPNAFKRRVGETNPS